MSAQGSIYVSTARNSRHFNRVELMQMVEMETDFREDVKLRIVEDMQNDLDTRSIEYPLSSRDMDYTKLYVGIDQHGTWTNFSDLPLNYDYLEDHYIGYYDNYTNGMGY